MHSLAKLVCTMQQGVRRFFHRNDVAIVQPDNRSVLNERRAKVIKRLRTHFIQESVGGWGISEIVHPRITNILALVTTIFVEFDL